MKSFPGPFLARRAFLRSLSAALPAFTLLPRATRAATTDAKLPPIRALTRGPKFHWRGYYDKLLFDPGQRFAANEWRSAWLLKAFTFNPLRSSRRVKIAVTAACFSGPIGARACKNS